MEMLTGIRPEVTTNPEAVCSTQDNYCKRDASNNPLTYSPTIVFTKDNRLWPIKYWDYFDDKGNLYMTNLLQLLDCTVLPTGTSGPARDDVANRLEFPGLKEKLVWSARLTFEQVPPNNNPPLLSVNGPKKNTEDYFNHS